MRQQVKSAEDYFYAGTRHMAEGRTQAAMACFRAAIAAEPAMAEAYANLALLLDEAGQAAEAEMLYRQALALKPHIAGTHMNLGILLASQKRFAEAEAAYRQALVLDQDAAVTWLNLGALQICRKQEAQAEESLRTALRLDPECRRAAFNLSYLCLSQGRLAEGWQYLEARDWYARLERELLCPRWRGEDLAGRSLMIGFEAGQGDMIQFARYATVLKAMGAARIIMVCHPPLKRLFTTLEGVDEVYALDEPCDPSAWDFWTPPLSMPFYCQTRLEGIPADIPYLRADGALRTQFALRMDAVCAPADLRVGLVWKGSTRFENDDQRSLPDLKTLKPLFAVPGVRFFSLQKGAGADEAAHPPAGLPLVDLGPEIGDFADTAAMIMNLDLVITVDTAVAHLTGALGRPCWVLLPYYKTDWRWLKERSDSPWYPGVMRLFRQDGMGRWPEVAEQAAAALRKLRCDGW